MPKVICTLPHASELINGVKFELVPDTGMVSEEIDLATAERFASIQGYYLVDSDAAAKTEAEAKLKAEQEAKQAADAEAKQKAEAEKAKADEQAKAKAEAEKQKAKPSKAAKADEEKADAGADGESVF